MIDAKRRILLKGSLAAGAVGVAVGAGLLTPRVVLAEWPAAAFKAESVDDALNALLGSNSHETSDSIKIKAPDIAENGAVVPVTVESDAENISSISIIAAGNQSPLIASFNLGAKRSGLRIDPHQDGKDRGSHCGGQGRRKCHELRQGSQSDHRRLRRLILLRNSISR